MFIITRGYLFNKYLNSEQIELHVITIGIMHNMDTGYDEYGIWNNNKAAMKHQRAISPALRQP